MKLINRTAVSVLPKQPYVDWVNQLDSSLTGLDRPMTLLDQLKEGRIYLLAERERVEEVQVLLEDGWMNIFKNELGAWDEFEDDWPKPLTRELFDCWFEVAAQVLVFDLHSEPLMVAELDDC
ncbi:hypothetical protein [Motiliproteus sp. MSK22-1]|uniref:hypothetical protein n=1 Tax=Motiliproteus sp. MSK22-1 TaxID=1897630 RepID=UPI000975623D|nr:hypothetical protein [Motiliproteus sp. MSK22-1]OMH25593.1 hypothetical protein BGP75_23880 [Motiliproteus sp. MSK22-1]